MLGVQDDTLAVGETHVLRESGVRHPFGGVPRVGLLHHAVHLFEGETLGFGHQEVGEGEGDATEAAPQEKHLGSQVGVPWVGTYEVGSDDPDDLETEQSATR